jgi:hypothetical protein
MSPIQVANNWFDLYCFKNPRAFRRFIMYTTLVGSFLGAFCGLAAGVTTAWRAAGLPSVATENFVKEYVVGEVTPIAKAVTTLEARSSDLFSLQQAVLTKVSDPTPNAALIAQIANIAQAQKRIEAKLGNIEKPTRRVIDRVSINTH